MKTELDSNRLQTADYEKRRSRWNGSINATAQSFVDELLKMPVMEVLNSEPAVKAKSDKPADKDKPDDEKIDDKPTEKPTESLCGLPIPQQFLVKDDAPKSDQATESLIQEKTVTEKPVQAIAPDSRRNPEGEFQGTQAKVVAPVVEQANTETIEATKPVIVQSSEDATVVDAESNTHSLEELSPKPQVREKGESRKSRNTNDVKTGPTVSNNAVAAAAKTDQEPEAQLKSHRHREGDKEQAIKPTDDEPKLNRRAERLANRNRNEASRDTDHDSASRSDTNRDTPSISHKAIAAAEGAAPVESSIGAMPPTPPTAPTATATTLPPTPVPAAPATIADASRGTPAPANATDRGASVSNVSSTTSSNSSNAGSRAESTRGSIPTSLSRYQETKLVQRVLRGIEQLSNGGGQVRLRLHPQELGTLQMTLRIEGSQMSAKLEVENSTAKEALLQNLQGLKDRLADQGMKVERFEVTVASQSNSFGADAGLANGNQDRRSWEQQSTSRYATQNNNMISTERNVASTEPARTWSRTNGALDVKV